LRPESLLKGLQTSLAELSSKLSQLESQLPVVNEALNELREISDFEIFFSGMQSTLNEAIFDFKSLTELFSQSFDLVHYLKVRFDALDVEFAELYERFGELDS
jgi:chaperonin cofactor prefoldin